MECKRLVWVPATLDLAARLGIPSQHVTSIGFNDCPIVGQQHCLLSV